MPAVYKVIIPAVRSLKTPLGIITQVSGSIVINLAVIGVSGGQITAMRYIANVEILVRLRKCTGTENRECC